MGNKTIYVKNEELWETARSIAGKAGLSAFVEEAVQGLVKAKQLEQRGQQRFSLPFKSEDEQLRIAGVEERLGFTGKCLTNWGLFVVYLTKGGTFIVVDMDDHEEFVADYRTYDELKELEEDEAIARLDKDNQDWLWEQIRDALPPPVIEHQID